MKKYSMEGNIRWMYSRLSFRGSIYLNTRYTIIILTYANFHSIDISRRFLKNCFSPSNPSPLVISPDIPFIHDQLSINGYIFLKKKKKKKRERKRKKTKLVASKLFQVVTNSDQNETQKRKYFINKYLLYRESELPMKENLIQLYPPRTRPVWIDRPIHRSFHDRSIVRRNYSAYVTGC